ncbi:hypothetical protein [Tuberibacillus sp. Marseille-P3662]|uniref:hypothetical protein n=1 Tax=Tuberibacillus sp. Marseille-P3662 TaxID=1965358 RepID=UPI000A1C9154|nr:hypothetical protein [Tuberibacillus sp. Marseille-P3662]
MKMEEFSYNYYNMDFFQLDRKERVLVGMKANQDYYNQGLGPIKTKDKVMGILALVVPIISIVIILHWTTVFSIIAGLMVATFFGCGAPFSISGNIKSTNQRPMLDKKGWKII